MQSLGGLHPRGMRTLLLFAIFLFSTSYLFAQGVVYGTVTDEAGEELIGASLTVEQLQIETITGIDGSYSIQLPSGQRAIRVTYTGYEPVRDTVELTAGDSVRVDFVMPATTMLEEVVVTGLGVTKRQNESRSADAIQAMDGSRSRPAPAASALSVYQEPTPTYTGESYRAYADNPFTLPQNEPLSTFGADVDVAAYANVRRFLNGGSLPPADAVRTEELINYFSYEYPAPTDGAPVAFATELGACPWQSDHRLLRIGLQAKDISIENLPAANLTFLLDVSGSMNHPDKLTLLQKSMRLLVERLRPADRVAIVVYAGAAGVVLPPTAGTSKDSILSAIDRLRAGGSTAGGAGIKLAYQLAKNHFVKDGNNRIILATDGDFNVGTTNNETLEELVEREAKSGVFLSVLGFGQGNYQDDRMQSLAEHGNGNAAYIDGLLEARKVLVEEFGGTLFTVAKDVKLQVEFNPAHVAAYRLIGYESRLLAPEDFNDDKKDAGDMGAGHTVTALYELIPTNTESPYLPSVDALKYQGLKRLGSGERSAGVSEEWATVRMKYKAPNADKSADKVELPVLPSESTQSSSDFQWAAAMAGWSMLLQQSELLPEDFGYAELLAIAEQARGEDVRGYRAEALRLMGIARDLGPDPELVEAEIRR